MNPQVSILVSVLLACVAQLLFKKGVNSDMSFQELGIRKIPSLLLGLCLQFYIMMGFVTYGLATFFWLIALSKLDFSYVFPFISLTLVFVPAGAWLFFDEKISIYRKIGIGVVCIGVLLVAGS